MQTLKGIVGAALGVGLVLVLAPFALFAVSRNRSTIRRAQMNG